MAKKKSKLKISKVELGFYVVCGALGLVGLIFVIFGIIGNYLPVPLHQNFILVSEDVWLNPWSKLGYRYWGLIDIAVAVVVTTLVGTFFARAGDRDSERAQRRAQRLAIEAEPIEVEVNEEKIED